MNVFSGGASQEHPGNPTLGNGAQVHLCESIRCEHGAICEMGEDGFARCSCQFNCSSGFNLPSNRICASDLKLYSSECDMRREACHRQTELRPRPMELCEGKFSISIRALFL